MCFLFVMCCLFVWWQCVVFVWLFVFVVCGVVIGCVQFIVDLLVFLLNVLSVGQCVFVDQLCDGIVLCLIFVVIDGGDVGMCVVLLWCVVGMLCIDLWFVAVYNGEVVNDVCDW